MDELEKALIEKFNTMNRNYGYNRESGGKSCKKLSEETKKKISISKRGHSVSEETRKKLSQTHKGLQAGENNPRFGVEVSEETRKKLRETSTNAKKVICIETKKIYPSVAAANREFGLSSTSINFLCNKDKDFRRAHKRAGYHWAWLSDYEMGNY